MNNQTGSSSARQAPTADTANATQTQSQPQNASIAINLGADDAMSQRAPIHVPRLPTPSLPIRDSSRKPVFMEATLLSSTIYHTGGEFEFNSDDNGINSTLNNGISLSDGDKGTLHPSDYAETSTLEGEEGSKRVPPAVGPLDVLG